MHWTPVSEPLGVYTPQSKSHMSAKAPPGDGIRNPDLAVHSWMCEKHRIFGHIYHENVRPLHILWYNEVEMQGHPSIQDEYVLATVMPSLKQSETLCA